MDERTETRLNVTRAAREEALNLRKVTGGLYSGTNFGGTAEDAWRIQDALMNCVRFIEEQKERIESLEKNMSALKQVIDAEVTYNDGY